LAANLQFTNSCNSGVGENRETNEPNQLYGIVYTRGVWTTLILRVVKFPSVSRSNFKTFLRLDKMAVVDLVCLLRLLFH